MTSASGQSAPPVRPARADIDTHVRPPIADEAPPPSARLLGMVSWAAACVLAGLLPASRVLVAVLFGGPDWYPPTAITIGLVGTGAMVAAFGPVRHKRLPWYLLGVATMLLATNVTLVYTVD